MGKQWHQLEKLDHKSLKKLQQDREKQTLVQQQGVEKKKYIVIASAVVFAIVSIMIFISVMGKRAERRESLERRAKMMISTVTGVSGEAFYTTFGNWEKATKGYQFDKENKFKTEKDGMLIVELQLKNQLKLASNSEMVVPLPILEDNENKIKRERAILNKGEITITLGVDGREILEAEAGGIIALGASGLFKVLYNPVKNSGEIVVKNGLVEVYTRDNPQKRIKVSGFYKVVFQKGAFNSPSQASIIQYDWR